MTALMATAVAGRSRPSPAVMQADPSDVCSPPARPAGLVARPRLVRRLMEARDVPLTLLVAPAGYGKTTLLVRVGRDDPRAFAWIRAGAGTSASTLAGLLDVEQTRIPECWCLTTPTRFVTRTPWLSSSTPPRRCPRGLSSSCPRGPSPGLRWAAASTPEACGAAYRGPGDGRRRGGRPPPAGRPEAPRPRRRHARSAYRGLARRPLPRGAVGARRARRSCCGRGFAGDDRLVADYLRDELLAPLDAAQTAFLVRTSVLDTLSAPACDAVLDSDGSATALADLARSNTMLVALDRSGESYRHHRLFGEMLRAELRRTRAEAGAGAAPARGRVACETRRGSRRDSPCGGRGRRRHGGRRAVVRGRRSHRRRGQRGGAALARGVHPRADRCACAAGARRRRRLACGRRRRTARALDHGGGSALDGRRSGVTRQLRDALAILRATCASEGIDGMGATWPTDAAVQAGRSPLAGDREAARRGRAPPHRTPRRRAPRPRGRVVAAAPPRRRACRRSASPSSRSSPWTTGTGTRRHVLAGRARSQVRSPASSTTRPPRWSFAVSALDRAQRGVRGEARCDLLWSRRLLRLLVDFLPWYEIETRIVLARAALCLGDLGGGPDARERGERPPARGAGRDHTAGVARSRRGPSSRRRRSRRASAAP